jgi:hypothetical protein
MRGAMNNLPIGAYVALYKIKLCGADDADSITAETLKRPQSRKSPLLFGADAANAINLGIRECLSRMSLARESPPSEQAEWASQLANSLQDALALLSPTATPVNLPPLADVGANISRLFGAGDPPDAVKEILKEHGFESPWQATEIAQVTEIALSGVWLAYTFAYHAEQAWRRGFRSRSDRSRPNPELMAWVTSMGIAYNRVIGLAPPSQPTDDGPFLRFCDGVRRLILRHQEKAASSDEVVQMLFRAVRAAKKKPVAEFICRNKPWKRIGVSLADLTVGSPRPPR